MAKRLNDTAALSAAPSGDSGCKTVTVSVSQISNGYVTRRTEYGDGMDDYKSSETYSTSPPRLGVTAEPRPRSAGTLSSAIKALK